MLLACPNKDMKGTEFGEWETSIKVGKWRGNGVEARKCCSYERKFYCGDEGDNFGGGFVP